MTPIVLGAIATAAGGALLLVVGWGLRDRGARRTEAVLCGALQRGNVALHRANTRAVELDEELAVVKGDLAIAERAVEDLLAQVAEALRIIADLSDARLDDAQVPKAVVPPQVWAALMEARENPGVN